MDTLKKLGPWIAAVVLIIAAVVFYILIVRKIASDRVVLMAEVEKNRATLENLAKRATAGKIPNATWIEAQRKNTEQLNRQTDDAELYLASQPRWCHTRWFFDNELFGSPMEIRTPIAWLDAYNRHNEELRMQIGSAGLTNFRVDTLNALWGMNIQTEAQMTAAMEYYWFQKDLADVLTGQVEKDLAKLIQYLRDSPTSFPAKPSDLVINRNPKRLDEFLRAMSEEELRSILSAVLINEKQQDLAMIFNEILPDKFPWDRPPEEQDKYSVLGLTMDDEQQRFLERLVPPGKPDLYNNQRFTTFVRELRTVRYRTDVIRLLESHQFEDVAEWLRVGSTEAYSRLRHEVNDEWSRTKLAQVIAAVVSVKDEKDYELLRNNHEPKIEDLTGLQIHMPLLLPGSAGGPEPHPELYRTVNFVMRVKIPFDRIPIFLRRMLNTSWVPDVQITRVQPVVANAADRVAGRATAARPTGAVSPGAAAADIPEVGNSVWIDLSAQAYHFAPLVQKLKDHYANAAAVTPPERHE
jgi:hypothetical protein